MQKKQGAGRMIRYIREALKSESEDASDSENNQRGMHTTGFGDRHLSCTTLH